MLKDTQLATNIGAEAGAPMPLAGLVREIFRAALVEHGATSDVNMLIRSMERAADVKVLSD
jgi:3-hydroxyisobutyrate dehydrogenase-like beta-hydroxyacid dehydrogenase